MKRLVSAVTALLVSLASIPTATAAVCAKGVYRAGCAGPNGAAVVRKPPVATTRTCAAGPHAAGCVGPHGAAVVDR